MDIGFPPFILLRLIFTPTIVFKRLADARPAPMEVFLKIALWFGMLPPIFAYIGALNYGWNLGTIEPLYFFENNETLSIEGVKNSQVMVVSGHPQNEPIHQRGPYVD